MGVVSAVEERSRSLAAGEKCKGGGVSRESSFTTWVNLLGRSGEWMPDEREGAGERRVGQGTVLLCLRV